MKKPLLVILLSVFMYGLGLAAPTASFTFLIAGSASCAGIPATVSFTNTSTIDTIGFIPLPITSTYWNFGDGTSTSTAGRGPDEVHTYTVAGTYLVLLIVIDSGGRADTTEQAIVINSLTVNYSRQPSLSACGKVSERFSAAVQSLSNDDSLSFTWNVFGSVKDYDYTTYDSSFALDFVPGGSNVAYCQITSRYGNQCYLADTFSVTTLSPIVPTAGAFALTANRQCDGGDGWVNYFYDNNTPGDESDDSLVLSLQPNGNDIGTIGDGTFSVSTIATAGAGSNSAISLTNPLISNQSGFWVMNRYWSVNPTKQPTTPVGVRFYFNNQDVADVNASYPSHNLNVKDLIFYKTHGGNPDPTTNLAGAEYITSLSYYYYIAANDTTHWADFDSNTDTLAKHMAQFNVTSFSGGGGGATGNGQVLPVQLTSFTAANVGNKVNLQWTTAQENNVSKYLVQVSADGRQFTTIGSVNAKTNASSNTYAFSYEEAKLNQAYYRLLTVEKNGTQTGSNIVPLLFNRISSHIALYPNPAKNSVQVKAAMFENKTAIADIYNAAGVKVFTAKLAFTTGVASMNTAALASGRYTVVLRNEQKVAHVPLVIVK